MGKATAKFSGRRARVANHRSRARVDVEKLLHPELREGTRAAAGMFEEMGPLSASSLSQFRSTLTRFAAPVSEDVPIQRKLIRSADGHKVPVYITNARPGTSRPAILHAYGGGFVAGSARNELRMQQTIAAALDCVTVSVDYRRAPEAGWRKSVEDNYTGLRWLHSHGEEIGVDPARIAVMGESAGGGHAALLAIAARDRGEVPLVLQTLIYPMLDDRTGSTQHPPPHVGTMIWPSESNRFGWRAFLGVPPGGSRVPAAAVPARTKDLRGLAPAFIAVGALDLFLEEDLSYAGRLLASGVPTELHVIPGAVHGFYEFSPESSLARGFVKLWMDALRRAFGLPVD